MSLSLKKNPVTNHFCKYIFLRQDLNLATLLQTLPCAQRFPWARDEKIICDFMSINKLTSGIVPFK